MFWKDEAVSYDTTDSGNFSPSMILLQLFCAARTQGEQDSCSKAGQQFSQQYYSNKLDRKGVEIKGFMNVRDNSVDAAWTNWKAVRQKTPYDSSD